MRTRVKEPVTQSVTELLPEVAPEEAPVGFTTPVAEPVGFSVAFEPAPVVGFTAVAAPVQAPVGFTTPLAPAAGFVPVESVELVVEREVVLPPPPPRRRGSYFYPAEQYYQAFPNVQTSGCLPPGRRVNFEEARRSILRGYPRQEAHFVGRAVAGSQLSTFTEHRSTTYDYPLHNREWVKWTDWACQMRDFFTDNPEKLLEGSNAQCVRAAMVWAGLTPQGLELDVKTLWGVLEDGPAPLKKTGPFAALIDANIYLAPADWGESGRALDLCGYFASGGGVGMPKNPVENFVFDQGLVPDTQFISYPEAEGLEVEAALLHGAYEITGVTYHSALGWKERSTGGDTIGWRQLSMRPLLDRELPSAA